MFPQVRSMEQILQFKIVFEMENINTIILSGISIFTMVLVAFMIYNRVQKKSKKAKIYRPSYNEISNQNGTLFSVDSDSENDYKCDTEVKISKNYNLAQFTIGSDTE